MKKDNLVPWYDAVNVYLTPDQENVLLQSQKGREFLEYAKKYDFLYKKKYGLIAGTTCTIVAVVYFAACWFVGPHQALWALLTVGIVLPVCRAYFKRRFQFGFEVVSEAAKQIYTRESQSKAQLGETLQSMMIDENFE